MPISLQKGLLTERIWSWHSIDRDGDGDTETEEAIQENLDRICADRTAFVIAHRFSTIRDADRVAVMDGGEIIETGTHDSLVRTDGTYADLWASQSGSRPGSGSGEPSTPKPGVND